MTCFSPIFGHRAADGLLTFSKKDAQRDRPIVIRCGRCMPCRIFKTAMWAIRNLHESRMHEQSIFLSLTYSDENLPYGETLIADEIAKFIRRLRIRGHKVRYYGCGEYGDTTFRPHYHLLIYGYRPDDAKLHSEDGEIKNYTSKSLDEIWGLGFAQFSDVTYASAAYTCGYSRKKIYGERSEAHYQNIDQDTGQIFDRMPEFSRQSTSPGIGEPFFKKYGLELYRHDACIINGKETPLPPYYDRLCEKYHPELWQKTRENRAKIHNLPVSKRVLNFDDPDQTSIVQIGTFADEGKTKPELYKGSNAQLNAHEIIREAKGRFNTRNCD